ncbi:B3 domain-containing protein REM10-like [Vigna unguiculata]|uniref:TF-B3 domain-containing protein n=1 Tax=Vigna unguiculata TaxID=3917 RepID=A0A4D6NCI1_VIGUN|nr:B3 domain-containing protein REM10-like [Vigna unguiculata]QCE10601.1 hypothetical protein DEO72_LG10g1831 [Vigna unguiculata]
MASSSRNAMMYYHPFWEYIQFDPGFVVYWSKEVRHNLNYLVDPRGNKIVIRIGQTSVPENFFCGGYEIASFYKLKENYFVAIKYLGNRVFDLRIFDTDMTEIQYPAPKNPTDVHPEIPLPRFFNCFNVKLSIQQESITLADAFSRFWDPTFASDNFEMIDPYLDAQFADVALVKSQTSYNLSNESGDLWECNIRWSNRSGMGCYITQGWNQFCIDNGLEAGNKVMFGVDKNRSRTIHVLIT